MERLFVYGTLGPGRPNEHILKHIGRTWQKGFVWGKLYKEGWGSDMGYPGIRLDDKVEIIRGYVFSSDKLKQQWDELDKFEGEAYKRIKASVTIEDTRETVEAFLYALQ